jgi:RNA polymerase sigma factor (sigma-70 family)
MTEDHEPPEVDHGSPGTRRGADDAHLVERVRAGDPNAFGVLYDTWFDRVLDLAYRILFDEDAAADVAQETFLSAWRNLDRLDDPYAFGGWLLRIARNAALDRKRKEQRSRPVDEARLAMIERTQATVEDRVVTLDDPARVAEDNAYVALVWDAAETLGDRDREVLDLNLRHGLEPAEIADVVGLNRNAANQLVHRVKQRLTTAIGARVLWRSGEPSCSALRAELVAAEIDRFDADAVRAIDRHAAACEACRERKRTHLSPAQMFSAVPIMGIPALKAKTAYALAAQGVPMGGSLDLTPPRSQRHLRLRRVLLASAVAGLVIVVALMLGAVALDQDPQGAVTSVPVTTTSIGSTSTTAATTSTSGAPVIVPPPLGTSTTVGGPSTTTSTAVATTTTTTLTRAGATLTVQPARAISGYSMAAGGAPHLTWTATGPVTVHVYDSPGRFDSTKKSGTSVVCPGSVTPNNTCAAKPGSYTYALDLFDITDERVAHRSVTLVIG